ncbi:MAG: type I DNA topoisomerase [Parcubacteria group bacterium]
MSKTLVIVESPTKARTIGGFIGDNFKVLSSYGHVRDLPKSKLGIDTEGNFDPQYVIPTKNRKRVNELKKEAASAEKIILATDEDREGEAIAWHLVKALDLENKKYERIAFHEITSEAIKEALSRPRKISIDLVDAQQARRVLDRLVGYKLSPFLWKKIMGHLSAGRVQSVAVRLIVEREEEIRKFIPETYYTIKCAFKTNDPSSQRLDETDGEFEATLLKINGKAIPKPGIKDENEANDIVAEIKKSACKVYSVEEKRVSRSPNPPFTTSTLQQECSRRLGFSAKTTMMIAQHLYEEGHITYMRTDSLNLSPSSTAAAKNWLSENLGNKYSEKAPRIWKTKSKSAQEAHEAIRPTDPKIIAENLSEDERSKKLYDLIWRRFTASQMPDAVFSAKRILVESGKHVLSASGSSVDFDGYLKIWPSKFEEKSLPDLRKGESLRVLDAAKYQHETEPPARYNEASLIKTLEEFGIGRPSTYAPIISVIQARQYVDKNEQRRFVPTDIGEKVNKLLTEHFPEIVDISFTADMENKLDAVASGKEDWKKIVIDFYEPFTKNLERKYEEVEKESMDEATDEICEKCGRPMIIKRGRFGRFLACSGYPECKNAKRIAPTALKTETGEEMVCPKCSEGKVIPKRTRKGRMFYGCSRYPDCDFASWTKPAAEKK